MLLKDKVAIVTGSAQGIGKVYALRLASEGAVVVVNDILDCSKTVSEIQEGGGQAIGCKADVSLVEGAQGVMDAAVGRFGQVDVLVNNAAVYGDLQFKPFHEITVEEWDRVMAVNLRGLFLCCRAVLPVMKRQGKGKIINVASSTFFTGVPLFLHYVTSKGGVIAFTRALARELGEHKINVNAVAPGYTMSEANLNKPRSIAEMVNRARCLKRDELPEDLAGTVVFLASDDSDFITGQTILVDGGYAMH